tara:strand:- start:774 stop:1130 length:357 start_codon:yes stop_codon:yes gene_type:complete
MVSVRQRMFLFLLGCIPMRIVLAMLPYYITTSYLPYFGILLLIIALGFFTLYFKNLRLNSTEGGGKTWWADFRLLHGFLYLCAAIYAFQEKILSAVPLVIDVILGLILFIYYHNYSNM